MNQRLNKEILPLSNQDQFERRAMMLAIEQGWEAAGVSTPNPPVGCVIVDAHGTVVGRGCTSPAGGAHAEINALAEAGDLARGCIALVTLEPCAHFGKTPPCADALVAAGIKRVVFAVADPNPVAAGGGNALREQGVDVFQGLLEQEARAASLEPWLFAIKNGRPFVSLKYAATLDGKIAAADGSSQWVTSEASRGDVQMWRARCDAIMIGTNTAILDNPRLTLRKTDGSLQKRQLLRVVVGNREVPSDYHLHEDHAQTLFIRDHDPQHVLEQLHALSIQHVYLEGGHTLAAAFMRAGLIDRVFVYISPKFLGLGTPAIGDLGIQSIAGARRLRISDVTTLVDGWETDIRLIGYPIW